MGLGYAKDPKVPATMIDTFLMAIQEENPTHALGVDNLANSLYYLDPAEVLSFVTSHVSKTWKKVSCNYVYQLIGKTYIPVEELVTFDAAMQA